jgi:hypothetical protein
MKSSCKIFTFNFNSKCRIFKENKIEELYNISRKKYTRSLLEAKKVIEEEQKDVVEKLTDFAEPLI